MVLVHCLPGISIDVKQAFKTSCSASIGCAKVKAPPKITGEVFRNLHISPQPDPTIIARPGFPNAKYFRIVLGWFLTGCTRAFCFGKRGNWQLPSPALLTQTLNRLAQALIIVKPKWHSIPPNIRKSNESFCVIFYHGRTSFFFHDKNHSLYGRIILSFSGNFNNISR